MLCYGIYEKCVCHQFAENDFACKILTCAPSLWLAAPWIGTEQLHIHLYLWWQAKGDMKGYNYSVGATGADSTKLHFQSEQRQTVSLPCQYGDEKTIVSVNDKIHVKINRILKKRPFYQCNYIYFNQICHLNKFEGTLNKYKPLWKSCRKQELPPLEYCRKILKSL